MAATITWAVNNLECKLIETSDGTTLTNTPLVLKVHWSVTAADGDVFHVAYGQQDIPYDPDATFTPYDDLTEETIIGWVKAALGPKGVAEYQAIVLDDVASRVSTPIVTPPLPWNTAE